ncbi:MAG: hypothetical protein SFU27_05705 [Thermonemataceae bacterium]|nr:hypothetical protein [Thermonemataceae bacterium]
MKKLLYTPLFLVFLLLITEHLQAQTFNKRFTGFSRKKLIYIETEDGKKIQGYLNGLKKDKGLIKTVKFKDKIERKLELEASQIKRMYLFPSSYAKVEGILLQNDAVSSWGNESFIDTSLIKQGYALFEKVVIQVEEKAKKGKVMKEKEVMLQLLNPHFSVRIKVYDNPNTENSALIEVGGISVVKGTAVTYYIKKSADKVALKIYSWDYSKKFADIFGDSQDFMEKYGEKPLWMHLERDIYQYTLLTSK